MKLYAIEDVNTGLFLTSHDTLEPLGEFTTFFKDRKMAEKEISYEDSYGFEQKILANALTWKALESKYCNPAWFIDVTNDEFEEIKASFDFKVVRFNLTKDESK